jgi:S-adenosylmethionine:tRNA ribosyltransferase-isomerase
MDSEWLQIEEEVANIINQAKEERKKVFAVGTTCVRALESVATSEKDRVKINPFCGETNLYIFPGYKFKVVDGLITNFHTPCSTNLVLVSAFCGKELIKKCYQYAIEKRFRFYSFGDAMLIC